MRQTLIALLLTFIYYVAGHFIVLGLGYLYVWLAMQPWWLVILLGGILFPFLIQLFGGLVHLLGYAVLVPVGRIGIGLSSAYFIYNAAVLLWQPAMFDPDSGFSLFLSRITCSISALTFFGMVLVACFHSEEE